MAYETLLRNIERQLRFAVSKDINHILEFVKALEEVYNMLKPYNEEVKQDIVSELKWKKNHDIGYRTLMNLLRKIVVHGVIEVNGRLLSLLTAAKKIYSESAKGHQVTIILPTRKGSIEIKANTLKQLVEELSSIDT